MTQHPFLNYGVGALGAVVAPLLIQSLPEPLMPSTKIEQTLLYLFGTALAAVFSARLMVSLNKVADLPNKAGWDALTHTVNDTSLKLDTHIAGFNQWKQDMERRMSRTEDKGESKWS